MYKTIAKTIKIDGTVSSGVVRLSDLMIIPDDENLSEYEEYLAWLAEGNTPEPWKPEQ